MPSSPATGLPRFTRGGWLDIRSPHAVPRAISPPAPAPQTATPIEERADTLAALFPPHRVVLHNDEVHDQREVVRALLASVPELDEARATAVMLEAHQTGRAEVIVCPLERAELYRDRLASFGLTASVERV